MTASENWPREVCHPAPGMEYSVILREPACPREFSTMWGRLIRSSLFVTLALKTERTPDCLAERVGFSSLASRAPCRHAAARLRRSNRVRSPQPHSARKIKRAARALFIFLAVGRVCRRGCSPALCPKIPYRRSFLDSLGWSESSADDALLASVRGYSDRTLIQAYCLSFKVSCLLVGQYTRDYVPYAIDAMQEHFSEA
jgi:hypothetical protein